MRMASRWRALPWVIILVALLLWVRHNVRVRIVASEGGKNAIDEQHAMLSATR